ncbi:AAA family ATPase [Evansella cellulosilytica]|uniref:DNA topology modulation protein FlaR n=1 Tax=Evansella cellulosilytica (strain ATCC 21833 / DSM 2522 / FERM P-1141 / JCM 9156 / N-4) TaxID=649639 RepID=E6U1Y4_EVAC2|nr:AAA family ATPase [Evansella cellulosilytica]ADU29228.1 hypothetical protein Bcell_0955 [Evansella cellulosilytica DSM 2522]
METNLPNKIHIIGSIGSGKTTLAKELSAQLNTPFYELDNVVWKRRNNGDVRRTEQERDDYLRSIVTNEKWIVEGVHHKWVSPSFHHADLIIFLNTNITKRKMRIMTRFIKQKIGVEKSNYKPSLKILKDLYHYNTVFENESKSEILNLLTPYNDKLKMIRNSSEVVEYFKKLTEKH